MVVWSRGIKEKNKKGLTLIKQDISKLKNTLLQWILQNIVENQTFQRIAKFIMADFYEINFMKGTVILVKVGEVFHILKSTSHCLLGRNEGGIW